MDPWQTILVVVGGNAALLGVLAWLARSLVSQLLLKDLEKFKADLARSSAEEATRLGHQLTLVAQEHQAVVSRLHEKRAEVIAQVYSLLVEVQWASQQFSSPASFTDDPPKKQQYVSALNAAAEFFRYFDKNRIYLPQSICERLDAFLKVMRQHVIGFGIWTRIDEGQLTEDSSKLMHEAWAKAAIYFAQDAPATRAALEKELRAIIGVRE
jgi:hypothetical protein